jgi:NhaA family Na+:H+ antiporter
MASVRRAVHSGGAFLENAAASGIVLMAAAVVAVAWANVAPASYEGLRAISLTIGIAPLALSKPSLLWINDGLMAVFFFLVALEIKREMVRGELASARKAVLPVVAAACGMAGPAAIYAVLNLGGPGVRLVASGIPDRGRDRR